MFFFHFYLVGFVNLCLVNLTKTISLSKSWNIDICVLWDYGILTVYWESFSPIMHYAVEVISKGKKVFMILVQVCIACSTCLAERKLWNLNKVCILQTQKLMMNFFKETHAILNTESIGHYFINHLEILALTSWHQHWHCYRHCKNFIFYKNLLQYTNTPQFSSLRLDILRL